MFYSSKIRKLLNSEDIVEIMINTIPMYIKQCKIKNTISSITLLIGKGIYSFPPTIIVEIDGSMINLDFWELKPKELHYFIDAISGDTNRFYLKGDRNKIEQTYINICEQLNQYDWQAVCKPSATFVVKYEFSD